MATVYFPTVMRKCVGGRARASVPGETVSEVLHAIYEGFPALRAEILDCQGKLKPFIAVFVNSTSLSEVDEHAPVRQDDEIHIVPAIAGGAV
jgi:sulfur-carrier protein